MIKALIFDVDGTLADTEEAHRRAFNDTFAASGLRWYWDVATYTRLLKTTGGKERMDIFQKTRRTNEPQLDREQINTLHAQKTARYAGILAAGGVLLRDGVDDLISRASAAGLKLAIATTTSRPNIEALTACCWGKPPEKIFDIVATGEQVKAKKPAPDLYELALAGLGLPPEACLAFEDSRNGVLSASRAGLRTIVTPCQYTAEDDFSGAARVIPSLKGFTWA